MAPDVCIVGRQGHEEMDQGEDDEKAAQRGQNEHDLGVLHKVLAEHLDLGRAADLHVLALGARGEHEVERVEVDESLVPLDLVRVADAPADGVEDSHDDATRQHNQPGEQQQVRDEDENHASWE